MLLSISKTKILKKAKQQSWLHFCSTLDSCTSNTKVWKMLRKMDGSPSFDFQYPIIDNGSFLEHSINIANCFADAFSQHFNSIASVKIIKSKINNKFSHSIKLLYLL